MRVTWPQASPPSRVMGRVPNVCAGAGEPLSVPRWETMRVLVCPYFLSGHSLPLSSSGSCPEVSSGQAVLEAGCPRATRAQLGQAQARLHPEQLTCDLTSMSYTRLSQSPWNSAVRQSKWVLEHLPGRSGHRSPRPSRAPPGAGQGAAGQGSNHTFLQSPTLLGLKIQNKSQSGGF